MKWQECLFDDLVRLRRGHDLPNSAMHAGSYPVVSSTSVKGYHNEFKTRGPVVITGRSGSLGSVQYIPTECWPLNTTLYSTDFRGNFPRFVYYFLSTLQLESFNSGAGVLTLNRNHLRKLRLFKPKAAEQKKIAAILTAYDDLIENNRQRIALLENMAEEIYREWFVRLRFPGHEHTPVHTGVPEGWQIKRLSDLISLEYGKALKEDERSGDGGPVVGSSGIVGRHSAPLVSGPGIVVGRKGNVGSVTWLDEGFFPIDTTYYVKTTHSLVWIFYLLQQMNFLNGDAAVPGLNRKQAYSNVVIFPPQELIEKFDLIIAPLFRMNEALSSSNNALVRIRNLLLNRLISGKIRVDDLDIQFPPSMQEIKAA